MPRPQKSRSPDAAGTGARRAALKLLDAVLRRGETLDAAGAAATQGLRPDDARLAHAIAGETLRRLPQLDELIDSAMERPVAEDAKSRMVLRLALTQAIVLDIPHHAVVATSLSLIDGGPKRLVHGVLSKLLKSELPDLSRPTLPAKVAGRWALWGKDVLDAAREMVAQRPPLDISLKAEDVAAPEGPSFAPLHRRVTEGGAVALLDGYAAGGWWVQDLAASIPARLVPRSARRVLDACAAPGGKTLQLAAAGFEVTALDLSERRLQRVRENLERTGLEARIVARDLRRHKTDPFDAVLLDAPCSATGTFRRHPEVLHRATPRIIAEMSELQAELLDASARLVKRGGSLVFATCSLEPEEGELQVPAFLARNPEFRIEPVPSVAGIAPTPKGWMRILPGMLGDKGGLDGFFIAHLVRDA
ncbi:RsmB/NOP family class I SAM-dependent RNA methyltransferase [Sphingomicrobium astaxanthinifaciens]|uniref:RsmB/NOP family class I SAM-dependent RNA methyltransferase n=1 Tax=Sphingomicrobium astaxanthinifaciens TaxID=1227949 RepID=UPI001FCA4ABD|nr:RsmB/NOP family class I SAM-dependent RNA methyltransferase [Sphingomicrobium astaxanthinifaciens]MCJ7421222.1 RsmB/NOP family class I SAM-dependent RNA methyltransferase [Sphingomicrobium astaxanthinifaciens]